MDKSNENEIGETKSIFKDGRFFNPWPTWHDTTFLTILKWRFTCKNNTNLPNDQKVISFLCCNTMKRKSCYYFIIA